MKIPYLESGTYCISWMQKTAVKSPLPWWRRLVNKVFIIKERVRLSFYIDQTGTIHPIASPNISLVQLELLNGYEISGMKWLGNEGPGEAE